MTAAGGSPLNAGDLKRGGLVVRPRCSCHEETVAQNGQCIHAKRASDRRYARTPGGKAVQASKNARRIRMRIAGEQVYLGFARTTEEHAFATDMIRRQKGNA